MTTVKVLAPKFKTDARNGVSKKFYQLLSLGSSMFIYSNFISILYVYINIHIILIILTLTGFCPDVILILSGLCIDFIYGFYLNFIQVKSGSNEQSSEWNWDKVEKNKCFLQFVSKFHPNFIKTFFQKLTLSKFYQDVFAKVIWRFYMDKRLD